MAIFRGIGGAGDSTTDATLSAVTEQATNAVNSATAAASSASSASTSASNASTSATNASASAAAASTSEINASASESAAATSAAEAAVSAASIDTDNIVISGGTIDNTVIGAIQPSSGYFINSSLLQDLTFTGNSRGIHFNSVPDAELYLNHNNGYVTLNLLTNSPGFDIAAAGFPKFTFTKATGDLTATSFTGNLIGNVKVETALTDLLIESDGSFGSFIGFNYNAATSSVISNSLFTQSIEFSGSNGRINFKTSSNIGASPVLRQSIKAGGQIEFYEDTGTTPKVTWVATTETLNFADNVKAVFGDGSDLEIYSDGTNGYITGTVTIPTADVNGGTIDDTTIGGTTAAAGTFTTLTANTSATLQHSSSTKLATTSTGIDVTGTVVADGLTVDTNTLYVDSGNNRVGIGTSSPDTLLNLSTSATDGPVLRLENADTAVGSGEALGAIEWYSNDASSGGTGVKGKIATVDDTGFGQNYSLTFSNGAATGGGNLLSERMRIASNGDISFYEDTGTTPKFFWDASAESLGIGTSSPGTNSPSTKLEVSSADSTGITVTSGTIDFGFINFKRDGATNASGQLLYDHFDNYMRMFVNGSERMRIDSSGNLLVGTTSSNPISAADDGVAISGGGYILASRASNNSAAFDRRTTDGDIVKFYKDGTTVGSIGTSTTSSNIYLTGASGEAGIELSGSAWLPMDNGSRSDGGIDLGASSVRHRDLYLSGKITNNGTGGINIDSSGNVGIGTSSPSYKLDVVSADVTPFRVKRAGAGGGAAIRIENGDSNYYDLFNDGAENLQITYNGSERMRIDSSGNVGIGTSSPDKKLHVVGDDGVTTFSSYGARDFLVVENNQNTNIQIVSNSANSGNILFSDESASGRGAIAYEHSSDAMAFKSAATERMRITSSGEVLVGKTSASTNSIGVEARADGTFAAVKSGGSAAVFGRNTDDGDIVQFRKDGTAIGSIGVFSAIPYFANRANDGIAVANNSLRPSNSTGANQDNVMDLGTVNSRWDDIYATNATIQTSDRNEKQDIEELSEAETRVAVAAKSLMRKYRWKSAVAEKGDDARIHFGIIAQDLQAAFAAEGLDAGRYAMFISSTWWEATETYTDDDGVEQTRTNTYETQEEAPQGATQRTRLGVRYPELLAFIIAAI